MLAAGCQEALGTSQEAQMVHMHAEGYGTGCINKFDGQLFYVARYTLLKTIVCFFERSHHETMSSLNILSHLAADFPGSVRSEMKPLSSPERCSITLDS
jgi:hypothetical protein